jgi:hypothetical protein
MPTRWTNVSPLSLIVSAMRVKSPFSQSALFGFMDHLCQFPVTWRLKTARLTTGWMRRGHKTSAMH